MNGDDGDNLLEGTSGDDTLRGLGGDDTLRGLGGDDRLIDHSGNTEFDGGSGTDTVNYYSFAGAISASLSTGTSSLGDTFEGVEYLWGSNFGDDVLRGDDGANYLRGFEGNDSLHGLGGSDTLEGGGGDDLLSSLSGGNHFDGGAGRDWVSYFGSATDVRLSLTTGSTNTGDTYAGIENLIGSGTESDLLIGNGADNELVGHGGNDTLRGERGNDTLRGGGGDDMLIDSSGYDVFIGGSGYDWVSYENRSSGVTAHLGYGTNNSGDTYDSIEALIGSDNGGDQLMGNDLPNILFGMGGDDFLFGGVGNDTLAGGEGDDTLRDWSGWTSFGGEEGFDVVSYLGTVDDVSASLATGNNSLNDYYLGIEGLEGSNTGNDLLIGDGGDNALYGLNGDDLLRGKGGDDSLYGGEGEDTLRGGSGDDLLVDHSGNTEFAGSIGTDTVDYRSAASAVTASLASGTSDLGDTFLDVENLTGSNGHGDRLTGDGGDNRLIGLGGDDTLDGGAGDDTLEGSGGNDFLSSIWGDDHYDGGSGSDWVSYRNNPSAVNASLTTGNNNSGDSYASIENFEGTETLSDLLIGSGFSNVLIGLGGDDTLRGQGGDDTVSGGVGADLVIGGTGDDALFGGIDGDTFLFRAGDGEDTVHDFFGGTDLIAFEIAGLGFGDLDFDDAGFGTWVDYGTGRIFMSGVFEAGLSAGDFDFL